jgi:predicted N-formylglutamate amidohydrolase
VVLVTCEHGGNHVPPAYRTLFHGQQRLLRTHRGYDAGALRLAQDLAGRFGAALACSRTTRLLVDLNRSPGHRRLFSELTRGLPRPAREEILAHHYRPYRDAVERQIESVIGSGRRVVHISSHSFIPELDGVVRSADIGLLYDPGRAGEKALAARWRLALRALEPGLSVRCNYPYRGTADGFTAHLRHRYPAGRYVGIEIEVNQRFPLAGGRAWARLRRILLDSLEIALR